MASRAKWEDMIAAATDKISSILGSSSEEKAKIAADNLGSGMADKAAGTLKDYNDRQKKALEDAGAL